MNPAHLHLMLNHLPMAGLGFAFLLSVLALVRKNTDLMKVSCWFYFLLGLLSILPIVTGDGAGEILLTWPGISSEAIEYHESWGYAFFWTMLANGILAAATLWYSRKKPGSLKKLNMVLMVIALIAFVFAFESGLTGGNIRHPEIEQGMMKK